MDGDPIPRTTGEEILAQVRDELRKINDRAESVRGAGELREPVQTKPAAKRRGRNPAAERGSLSQGGNHA